MQPAKQDTWRGEESGKIEMRGSREVSRQLLRSYLDEIDKEGGKEDCMTFDGLILTMYYDEKCFDDV